MGEHARENLAPAPWWRTPSRGRDALLLIIATLITYLATGDHVPFGSSNRYYEAARETLELGDWTVPHLHYAPYLEKPPLVYWLGGASRALGTHPLLLSLPSLLATLVMVLATWQLGRAWRNPGVALLAALMLLGCTFTQFMASVLTTDPLLAAAVSVAWWTWWEWEVGGRSIRRWLWAFYVAIAVGWLAKGPIALALPGAGIGLYALLSGGLRGVVITLWQMRPWLGVGIIVALNLPWTLAVWARDPRLIEFFYLRINFDAFATGRYNHAAPLYYYLPILLAALFPFVVIAIPLLISTLWRTLAQVRFIERGMSARPPNDSGRLFLACAVLGPFLLLSLSSAKLGTYLMPIMPAVLLLVADGLAGWRSAPRWALAAFTAQVVILILALAVAASAAVGIHDAVEQHRPLTVLGFQLVNQADLSEINVKFLPVLLMGLAALLLGLLAALAVLVRRQVIIAMGCVAIGITAAAAIVVPRLDDLIPDQNLDRLITTMQTLSGDRNLPMAQRDVVVVDRDEVHAYELPLTLGRRVAIVGDAREVGVGHFIEVTPPTTPLPGPGQPIDHPYQVCGENTAHPWLWSRERLGREWVGPHRVWLLCKDSYVDQLKTDGLNVHIIARIRRTLLVSNHP